MDPQAVLSLSGGALIGTAATIMLIFNGRVTGISGIIASSLSTPSREGLWRWTFLFGLVAGGVLTYALKPELFSNTSDRTLPMILAAGLLVGFGAVMGSGCTSGHGVCGLSRFSVRSLVATVTFILLGFLTVQLALRLKAVL